MDEINHLQRARKHKDLREVSCALEEYKAHFDEHPLDSDIFARDEYRYLQKETSCGPRRTWQRKDIPKNAPLEEKVKRAEEHLRKNPYNAFVLERVGTETLKGGYLELAEHYLVDALHILRNCGKRNSNIFMREIKDFLQLRRMTRVVEKLIDVYKETEDMEKLEKLLITYRGLFAEKDFRKKYEDFEVRKASKRIGDAPNSISTEKVPGASVEGMRKDASLIGAKTLI